MTFQSYYKMLGAADRAGELRRAQRLADPDPGTRHHGAGLVSGRHLGFSTGPTRAPEGDRLLRSRPDGLDQAGRSAGYWSAYWYNGYIVGSEIARGLDIFELKPSGFISKNEIDAAKSVRFDSLNVQDQPKFVWPTSFLVARAYVDQLARNNSLSRDQLATISQDLDRAERLSGQERQATLTKLQGQLAQLAQAAGDPGKVRMLASEVGDLATTQSAQR